MKTSATNIAFATFLHYYFFFSYKLFSKFWRKCFAILNEFLRNLSSIFLYIRKTLNPNLVLRSFINLLTFRYFLKIKYLYSRKRNNFFVATLVGAVGASLPEQEGGQHEDTNLNKKTPAANQQTPSQVSFRQCCGTGTVGTVTR